MPRHDVGFELTTFEIEHLEKIERDSNHKWQRRNGHILVKSLGNKCVGPTCEECGFQFCLMCEWPTKFKGCKGVSTNESPVIKPKKRTSSKDVSRKNPDLVQMLSSGEANFEGTKITREHLRV